MELTVTEMYLRYGRFPNLKVRGLVYTTSCIDFLTCTTCGRLLPDITQSLVLFRGYQVMLFITPTSSAKGAKSYFSQALAPSDYYIRDQQEAPGTWHGLGAELLGLSGEVTQQQFHRLCENQNPLTGEKLTARTKQGRRVLYDFALDAPKAVSLALEVCNDNRILEAFHASVSETMHDMEADMHARVRTGGADSDRRTANMVWAGFIHRTTRPVDGVPDPQLHCHAVVFNTTFDTVENRWKAAQFGNLVRDKLYYQAAFHARLAERMQALGYEVKRDGNSFTLAGVDRSTILKFSRRTCQIEAEAARRGITSPKAKGELGRMTREAKTGGATLAELRAEWRSRLTDDEREALEALQTAGQTATPKDANEAVAHAMAHCFERAAVVTDKQLVAEALMQSVGKARVCNVWQAAREADLISKAAHGLCFVTTHNAYRQKLAIAAFVRNGRGQHRKLGGAVPAPLDVTLSEGLRKAALTLLNSRDTVIGLRGVTGKTRMVQATLAAIEQSGKQVFAFVPSAKVARDGVLRAEGFPSAATVEKLLTDRKLHDRIKGQILWIDAAGLLSVPDMKRIFDLAKARHCRVVLSEDSTRHNSVARRDALRMLEIEAGMAFAQLKGTQSQTHEGCHAAVRDVAQGQGDPHLSATELLKPVHRPFAPTTTQRLIALQRPGRARQQWQERVLHMAHTRHGEVRHAR